MKPWLAGWVAILVCLYLVWWLLEGFTAWGENMGVRCELGYDPLTHICIDRTHGAESPCSGWSPPLLCWRRETVIEKRNQHGLNEREKSETEKMEAAGFVWDPNGYPRWSCSKLELTALRQPWMKDSDWDKHLAQMIAEAGKLRRFDELPFGTRFRLQRHIDTRRLVYVKLDVDTVIPWKGPAIVTSLPQGVLSLRDVRPENWRIVELFEPFADLPPAELENLPTFPQVWTALADWHAWQSACAEAADYIESSKWHDEREEKCKQKAAELTRIRENG